MTLKPMIVTSAAGLMALALTSVAALSPASAGWFDRLQGNDTGGIIPWSPEAERTYGPTAAAHCGTYNKVAVVTSIHRQPGDYISFVCAFPPDYDPRKGWTGSRL
jgi:hypothetical protein